MRIVHVIGGDLDGGASKGAVLLHEALLRKNVESYVICNLSSDAQGSRFISVEDGWVSKTKGWFYRKKNALRKILYPGRDSTVFNAGLAGADIRHLVLRLQPDIVHLHWIGHAVFDIRLIPLFDCPVVWTLRDMWAFTGGCHYSLGCDRFEVGCGHCPQLKSKSLLDVTKRSCESKLSAFRSDLQVIGISTWLTGLAKRSYALKRVDKFLTISNGINTGVFYPVSQDLSRRNIGVSGEKKIVSIGAQNLKDSYKGFSDAIEALNVVSDEIDILVLLFGRVDKDALSGARFEFMSLGYVSSDHVLRDVYSASDVYLAPSKMEAFGKTIAESMACGTQVVCYDSTGPKDIVVHGETGYLAKSFDIADLANGVKICLEKDNIQQIRAKCRDVVEEKFSIDVAAEKYIELYRRTLV